LFLLCHKAIKKCKARQGKIGRKSGACVEQMSILSPILTLQCVLFTGKAHLLSPQQIMELGKSMAEWRGARSFLRHRPLKTFNRPHSPRSSEPANLAVPAFTNPSSDQ